MPSQIFIPGSLLYSQVTLKTEIHIVEAAGER